MDKFKKLGITSFALMVGACTEPSQNVGTSQEALSEELTPLQKANCAWFPTSCKEGAPAFEPEVDKAFATDFEKNGGTLPEPERVEYNGDDTVSLIKICFAPRPFTNPAEWECMRPGCGCALCQQRNCYIIRYGTATFQLETGGSCLKGQVVENNGSYTCDVGGFPNT